MYWLRLLGGLALEGPSGPLSGRVVQQRQLALLALLAASRDSGLSRDKLVGYLWPQSDEERARHRLSDTLHVIRKALGEGAVLAFGEMLRLNPDLVRTDVCELEIALENGEPAAAVEAYGGPFLDGVHLGEAPEFERWVDGERERYAGLYARALEALAVQAEDAGEYGQAAGWWRRLAAQDPYDSRLVVRVMEALAAAGDVANALQHARVHELLLREELEVELPAEVHEAAKRLKAQAVLVRDLPSEASEGGVAEGPTVPAPLESDRQHRRRKDMLAAVGVVALGCALVVGWLMLGSMEPDRASVTVLVVPFDNLGTSEDEYLADDITKAITARLPAVLKLGVIAWTSAFTLKGNNQTNREIGTEWRVQYVMKGTVLRERPGDLTSRVRVTAWLVAVADDTYLWAESYDLEMWEIFRVYSDIIESVARELNITLTAQERLALQTRPTEEQDSAIAAFQALVGACPGASRALTQLGVLHFGKGDYETALDYSFRAIEADTTLAVPYVNAVNILVALGRAEEARTVLQRFSASNPDHPWTRDYFGLLETLLGNYDAAEAQFSSLARLENQRGNLPGRTRALFSLADVAVLRGRLAVAEDYLREAIAVSGESDDPLRYLEGVIRDAYLDVQFRGRPVPGLQRVERALRSYPREVSSSIGSHAVTSFYLHAGRPDLVRGPFPLSVRGQLALANGDYVEAIEVFRQLEERNPRNIAILPEMGQAYELAGEPDSALAVYERYVTAPVLARLSSDSHWLVYVFERLGRLYAERGDAGEAERYLGKLIAVWKDADPELQPRVEAARRAIQALSPGN